MRIAVYTIPYEVYNEVSKIHSLFENGLECLHLRKPGYSYFEYNSLLKAINSDYHDRIVLHHHYSLALKYDVKGVLIPDSNFIVALQARFLKSMKPRLTICSTAKTIEEAKKNLASVDCLLLGPLFVKYSETNIRRKFEQLELRNFIQSNEHKIFALGGIELKNIEGIQSTGFAGVVLQTSIWKTANILNSFRAFQMSIKKENGAPELVTGMQLVV